MRVVKIGLYSKRSVLPVVFAGIFREIGKIYFNFTIILA